jgi:hypothetical protein
MSEIYIAYEVAQYESWILSLFESLPEAKKYAEARAIDHWGDYDTQPVVDGVRLKHPDYSFHENEYIPYIKVEPTEAVTYDADSDGDEDRRNTPVEDIAEIMEWDREFVEDMAEVAFGDSENSGDKNE